MTDNMASASAFLPVCREDLQARGIEKLDFITISGDAYVDHASFGHAVVSRLFESYGYDVGIIPQPVSDDDYRKLGEPNIAFLVSSGVVDSMVNNYTVAKRPRDEDEYSPGGKAGLRPDRATIVYVHALKRLYPNVPVIIGGIEPSLRRFSHYDYWSDSVMPPILTQAKADLLIYGMGERPIMDLCERLKKNIPIAKIRDVRGTAYAAEYDELPKKVREKIGSDYLLLASHEEVVRDKRKFAESFKLQSRNTDGINGRGLIETCGETYVVQNPPQLPLTESQMDAVYALPYMRTYHPMYESQGGVPAIEEVKFSITSHRGCFGSCSFCALNYHQGRRIQRRSEQSILTEAEKLTEMSDFKGYIHDIGGATANFRSPACEKQEENGICQNRYCIGSKPCPNLKVSHREYLELLQKLRKLPKVKKVFIRSGVRFDYVMFDENEQFLNELVKYHVSGQLKIAPEHISDSVLKLMNKPSSAVYKRFAEKYKQANERNHMNQFLVPYFISSHPGCTLNDAIELALYLKSINYMPRQVQDFYPTPSTRSTCMFYTGLDPDTMEEVYVPRSREEKRMQRALLQYRKKENYFLVEKALRAAGREDLIGFRASCLIRPIRQQFRETGGKPVNQAPVKQRSASERARRKKK